MPLVRILPPMTFPPAEILAEADRFTNPVAVLVHAFEADE